MDVSLFLGPPDSPGSAFSYSRVLKGEGSGLSSAGCGLFSGTVCVVHLDSKHLWGEMGSHPFSALTSGSVVGKETPSAWCSLIFLL